MKTYPLQVHQYQRVQKLSRQQLIPAMVVSVHEILALLSALTVTTILIVLSAWLAPMTSDNFLGAITWGLGFIFLALATDNNNRMAILQLTTGIALLALALLQLSVSPEFANISGAIVSTWLAFAVFRQLR